MQRDLSGPKVRVDVDDHAWKLTLAQREAMATDRAILLCAQKKAKVNDPRPEGIHTFGTISSIA